MADGKLLMADREIVLFGRGHAVVLLALKAIYLFLDASLEKVFP